MSSTVYRDTMPASRRNDRLRRILLAVALGTAGLVYCVWALNGFSSLRDLMDRQPTARPLPVASVPYRTSSELSQLIGVGTGWTEMGQDNHGFTVGYRIRNGDVVPVHLTTESAPVVPGIAGMVTAIVPVSMAASLPDVPDIPSHRGGETLAPGAEALLVVGGFVDCVAVHQPADSSVTLSADGRTFLTQLPLMDDKVWSDFIAGITCLR